MLDKNIVDEFHIDAVLLLRGYATLAISALLCIPLSIFFPFRKNQSKLRNGQLLDTTYWLLDSIFHRPFIIFITFLLLQLFHTQHTTPQRLYDWLSSLPSWLQVITVVFTIDLLQYWVHRAMHYNSTLWKFHSIHHSSKDLDWLSSARLHPVNTIIYSILPGFIVGAAGFKPEAFALSATITFYSPLLHSNLNWTFGPLRYVIGSPVYHRYHHSVTNINKNLAFYFPFIDILFGTFYMPDTNASIDIGTIEPVPEKFFEQLIYPFRGSPSPKQFRDSDDNVRNEIQSN